MQPICLPAADQEFGGKEAVALGWGRFNAKRQQGHGQSTELQYVHLTVSNKKYRHEKMFGTKISSNKRKVKDVCSGDSGINNSYDIFGLCNNILGGPLVYYDPNKRKNYLIGENIFHIVDIFDVVLIQGTVYGAGYDCRSNTYQRTEGSRDGIWNKVTSHDLA